jgi:hypothetical protein
MVAARTSIRSNIGCNRSQNFHKELLDLILLILYDCLFSVNAIVMLNLFQHPFSFKDPEINLVATGSR